MTHWSCSKRVCKTLPLSARAGAPVQCGPNDSHLHYAPTITYQNDWEQGAAARRGNLTLVGGEYAGDYFGYWGNYNC